MVFYKSSKSEHISGGLAQLGERLPCKQEVTSSTLVFSTSALSTAEADKQKSTYACIKVAFCLSAYIGRKPVSKKALLSSSTQCGRCEGRKPVSEKALLSSSAQCG